MVVIFYSFIVHFCHSILALALHQCVLLLEKKLKNKEKRSQSMLLLQSLTIICFHSVYSVSRLHLTQHVNE